MLINVERTISDLPDRESRLKQALGSVDSNYEFVIIDCPPSLGILPRNALRASAGVIVPIQAEYYAMEGLSQIVSAIKGTQDPATSLPGIEGVLFTMYDKGLSLAREVAAEVGGHFRDKMYGTKIPRDVALAEAPSFGKCILDYDLRSRGAWAYLELAKEVLHDRRRQETGPRP
jgi:chromosome partitioning protein